MAADEEHGEGARALDGNQWVERLDAAQTRVAEIQGELAAARDAEDELDGQLATAHMDSERFVAEMASAQAETARIIADLTAALAETARSVSEMTLSQVETQKLKGQLTTAHTETARVVALMASAQADIAQVVDQTSAADARSGGPSLVVVDEGASSDLITGSSAVGPSASSASMRGQIMHGRIYRTAAEVREAVDMFVALYNDQCHLRRTVSPAHHRPPRGDTLGRPGRSPRKTDSCPGIRVRSHAAPPSSATIRKRGNP